MRRACRVHCATYPNQPCCAGRATKVARLVLSIPMCCRACRRDLLCIEAGCWLELQPAWSSVPGQQAIALHLSVFRARQKMVCDGCMRCFRLGPGPPGLAAQGAASTAWAVQDPPVQPGTVRERGTGLEMSLLMAVWQLHAPSRSQLWCSIAYTSLKDSKDARSVSDIGIHLR